jgi:putative endonuclease
VFYVYVLRSESDSGFYIGFSTNLRARLRQHQNGDSFATSHRGPWKLIYYEAYTEREDAEGRERFLKSGAGRRFLRAQLRHYLRVNRVKSFASRGSDGEAPKIRSPAT